MSHNSALLDLPAELRVSIFEYVLQDVRCRRPLIILDSVYNNSIMSTPPRATSILLACRLTYKECLPLLYNTKTVEISLRGERDTDFRRACLTGLGLVENCELLSRLRHLELEISFDASNELLISRSIERLQKLSNAFNKSRRLKTLDLVFYQRGDHYRDDETLADGLLREAGMLGSERLIGVSRNMAARLAMSPSKWKALRRLVFNHSEEEGEQFQEISLDYWDRSFTGEED